MTTPQQPILSRSPSGSLTEHLRPIIDFLIAQGNPPTLRPSYQRLNPDGFYIDRDGVGEFLFEQPLDVEAIQARFDLPSGIDFTQEGDLWDGPNRKGILQSRPDFSLPIVWD